MVEHMRRQSSRRAVTALADAALERLASVVRLNVNFQVIATEKMARKIPSISLCRFKKFK
jgi:hypothetical protein